MIKDNFTNKFLCIQPNKAMLNIIVTYIAKNIMLITSRQNMLHLYLYYLGLLDALGLGLKPLSFIIPKWGLPIDRLIPNKASQKPNLNFLFSF